MSQIKTLDRCPEQEFEEISLSFSIIIRDLIKVTQEVCCRKKRTLNPIGLVSRLATVSRYLFTCLLLTLFFVSHYVSKIHKYFSLNLSYFIRRVFFF